MIYLTDRSNKTVSKKSSTVLRKLTPQCQCQSSQQHFFIQVSSSTFDCWLSWHNLLNSSTDMSNTIPNLTMSELSISAPTPTPTPTAQQPADSHASVLTISHDLPCSGTVIPQVQPMGLLEVLKEMRNERWRAREQELMMALEIKKTEERLGADREVQKQETWNKEIKVLEEKLKKLRERHDITGKCLLSCIHFHTNAPISIRS